MRLANILFPATASNDHSNNASTRVAHAVFLFLAIVGLVRSCIHIFSPDGGAGSIAGIDVAVAGGEVIIFTFALWGGAQLLLGIVQLVVHARYKNLIPLMYLVLVIEIVLRMLAGWLHPVTFSHVPPGVIGNYIVLLLAIAMLAMLLLPRSHGDHRSSRSTIWQS